MSSSCTMPEEFYFEILTRLPVKSVFRCKSVCKSWYSMISNLSFAKFHIQENKNKSSKNSLLLGLNDDTHSMNYDSLEDDAVSVRMWYPFKSGVFRDIQNIRLLGSCNGLVFHSIEDLVYDDDDDSNSDDSGDESDDSSYGKDPFLCVWNPATKEYKLIPESPNTYFVWDISITGLGYDAKNDDYKFVVGTCSDEPGGLSTLVEVFSLRSNSWETIEIPYGFTNYCSDIYDKQKSGVLVNGDLHWLDKGEYGFCIVCFDSSSDMPSFKEIQLPINKPKLEFVTLGVLEEGCRLCVVADNGNPANNTLGRVEVWEMQVYGVRDSWTKRYIISNETITKAVMDKYSGLEIMWCFENGKIVFVDLLNVVLYDPNYGTAFERKLDKLKYFTSKVTYFQSLVSLNTNTYVGTKLSK